MFSFRQATAFGVFAAILALQACAASKSSGGGNGGLTGPSATVTAKLRTSDVLSGAAVVGASVSGSGLTSGTTDSSGSLTLTTTTSSTYGIDISTPSYVTRSTLLKIPGAEASVSLIANSFDLTAFNQMFRAQGLQRWTSVPALRIISNVVEFNQAGPTYTVTGQALTAAELASITADLSYGLPLLTGSVFQTFSSITTLPISSGTVTLLVEGSITFARCSGLAAARNSAGYGQWQFRTDDVVTGGMLCIDRDFDLSESAVGRGVRLHELGHALGYQHVLRATKDKVLMNPSIEINDVAPWDRDAARIAFQRPTGNRAPDHDPSSYSTNSMTRRVMSIDGCRARR